MRRVPLGQVRKIVQGQQTQVFMKNKGNNIAKKLEKMSMSLIYGHRFKADLSRFDVFSGKKIELWTSCVKRRRPSTYGFLL